MKPLSLTLFGLYRRRLCSTRSLRRITAVLALTIVYGVLFIPLRFFWGEGVSLLAVFPAALTGWFFGKFIGVGASLVLLLFNEVLWIITGDINLSWQFAAWSIVNLVFWGLGGYLSGLASELRYDHRLHPAVSSAAALSRPGWIEEAQGNFESEISGITGFIPSAILVTNRQGKVIVWNPSMETLTGITSQEILGKDCSEASSRVFKNSHRLLIEFSLDRPAILEKEFPGARRENQDLILETFFPEFKPGGAYLVQKARPLYNLDGIQVGAIQFLQDVTDIRLAQEKQSIREQRDPVTGLASLSYFEKQVTWLENSRSIPNSILLVRLKVGAETANTRHTKEGDLLKRAAVAIQVIFRVGDTVAYLGGHDFGILAPKADVGSAQRLAERLRKSLTVRSQGKTGPLTQTHFSVVAVTSLEAGTLQETFEQGLKLLAEG